MAYNSLTDQMSELGVSVYDASDITNIGKFAVFESEKAENFQLT
ncbi:hypothetical protein JCM19233_26 [Vibrio astriarenae]|nr:hypothetical protein JCM19233_26 [Vibrio sp. C7]